jgi:hypothetical protein
MRKGWFVALVIVVAALVTPVAAVQSGDAGWLKEQVLALHRKVVSHLHGAFSHGPAFSTATAPDIAGKWNVTVESPHGAMSASFVLKQDRTKVTGTMSSDHTPDAAIDGDFIDGALTFTVSVDHGSGPMKMTCKATLNAAGTLAGTISSEMGEMTWTAERAK